MTGCAREGPPGRALPARPVRSPTLSASEERDLARRCRAGDMRAKRRLVEAHLPFVRGMARRYARYGASIQDLCQEGTIGLLQALERFNADSGSRLAAFAALWVRSAMQRHVIGSWSLVRLGTTEAQRALFFRVRQLASDLSSSGGVDRERLDAALRGMAERTATNAADLWSLALRIAARDQSLDRPAARDDDPTHLVDLIPDRRPSPETAVAAAGERRLARSLVARALSMLSSRERIVIERRYLAEARISLAALARELDLSKERVRQIEARAIERLRTILATELFSLAGRHATEGGRT